MVIGEVRRAYPMVQKTIGLFLARGISPSTALIQQQTFEVDYNPDSRNQRRIIYGCIERGRANAVELWNLYIDKPGVEGFTSELAYLQYYEPEKRALELKSEDFQEFLGELHSGGFGKNEKAIIGGLSDYPEIAILWDKKMQRFSILGHNFLISTDKGPKSTWILPSFWLWCIREHGLYLQTLTQLKRQLERGKKTKMLLPTGISLDKALDWTTPIKAALLDGTTWKCAHCSIRNDAEKVQCVICGTSRPSSETN